MKRNQYFTKQERKTIADTLRALRMARRLAREGRLVL